MAHYHAGVRGDSFYVWVSRCIPEELPEMPANRDIEFFIDLLPEVVLVFKKSIWNATGWIVWIEKTIVGITTQEFYPIEHLSSGRPNTLCKKNDNILRMVA